MYYSENKTVINDKENEVKREHKVTSVADLKLYSQGSIVILPDFAEGQPFTARLRRPSLLVMAKSGKIPNNLLNTAATLFSEGGEGLIDAKGDVLTQVYDLCKIICEASLLEPTMDDISEAGLELTDEQIMAIFNYSQTGAKALDSFR